MVEKEFFVENITPNYKEDNPFEIDSVTITIKKDIGVEMINILIAEYTLEERI